MQGLHKGIFEGIAGVVKGTACNAALRTWAVAPGSRVLVGVWGMLDGGVWRSLSMPLSRKPPWSYDSICCAARASSALRCALHSCSRPHVRVSYSKAGWILPCMLRNHACRHRSSLAGPRMHARMGLAWRPTSLYACLASLMLALLSFSCSW